MDQNNCGSCWAFAVTGALTDRYCIWSGGRLFAHDMGDDSETLSPQPLLSCPGIVNNTDEDTGCDGGNDADAWRYFAEQGTLTCRRQDTQFGVTCDSGCAPYRSGNCGEGGDIRHDGCTACSREQCADGGPDPEDWTPERWANASSPRQPGSDYNANLIFKAAEYGGIGCGACSPNISTMSTSLLAAPSEAKPFQPDIEHIQREIMTNGPVESCFRIHDNFDEFFHKHPAGIYNTTNNTKAVGGHCVKIIGWGVDRPSGMEYWLIANSWTTNWGTHGYFRYRRGTNLGDLDGNVWTGCPPAEISLGTNEAPGDSCTLTRPNTTALSMAPPPRSATAGRGGDWVEHDTHDEALHQAQFLKATVAAIHADEKGSIAAVLRRVPVPSPGLSALREGDAALVKVRTQVVRGIHVHLQLQLARGGAVLEVHALHDAVHRTVTLTRPRVL